MSLTGSRADQGTVSYRDIIVSVTVLALLPRAFTRPFFGLLLFTWLAYMRPQDLCWGFAKPIRYSLYCAVLMFTGWFLYEPRKFTRFAAPLWTLLIFIACLTISLSINERRDIDRPWEKYFDLLKVFAVTYFTVGMVDTRERLHKILWTITLSLGFFGVKYGLHGLLRGGRILQGPGGMMLDNNDLCLAMAMNIPLLFFMGRQAKKPWLRRLCFVAVGLTAVTVVCTLSRGGFLTMCLAGFLIFNTQKKSILPWVVAGVLAVVVPLVLPDDAKNRLATLQDPTEEGSAAGRLYAWKVGLRMVAENPFFGVGFESFLGNFRRYDPIRVRLRDSVKSIRVAHNTYVQVWAELGTFAIISFLATLLLAVLWARKTRKEAIRARGPPWIVDFANMIEISLLCFMFGANFLNRAHFDLMYHLIALSVVLRFVAKDELRKLAPAPELSRPVFGPAPVRAFAPAG